MDAHWLRLHHGTYTDPKWRVVVARCHAMSRQVTTASVLAVWMCMLETASQAAERGTLDGWCHEDVAAALGLAEQDVAAIYDAMQGKTLDGSRLISWEKRQPKREREDVTAADRKRAQREREAAARGVTERDKSASRHVTPRGEERREEEKQSETPRSVDPSTLSASERVQDGFDGHDRDQVPEHGRAFERLDDHEQSAVRPLLGTLPPAARIELKLLAEFVDHARQKPGLVQSVAWFKQLSIQIAMLHGDGHDVNEAIRQTIAAGNCVQLLVPKNRGSPTQSAGNAGRRQADDFDGVSYD